MIQTSLFDCRWLRAPTASGRSAWSRGASLAFIDLFNLNYPWSLSIIFWRFLLLLCSLRSLLLGSSLIETLFGLIFFLISFLIFCLFGPISLECFLSWLPSSNKRIRFFIFWRVWTFTHFFFMSWLLLSILYIFLPLLWFKFLDIFFALLKGSLRLRVLFLFLSISWLFRIFILSRWLRLPLRRLIVRGLVFWVSLLIVRFGGILLEGFMILTLIFFNSLVSFLILIGLLWFSFGIVILRKLLNRLKLLFFIKRKVPS